MLACFSTIISTILASKDLSKTRCCTNTGLVCPMRCNLSSACVTLPGTQSSSANITVDAAVKVNPTPAALMVPTNKRQDLYFEICPRQFVYLLPLYGHLPLHIDRRIFGQSRPPHHDDGTSPPICLSRPKFAQCAPRQTGFLLSPCHGEDWPIRRKPPFWTPIQPVRKLRRLFSHAR